MQQYITFNFIIVKKNWHTRTSCYVIYNNDRACRNWEIMFLKYRLSVKKKYEHSQYDSWTIRIFDK